MLIAREKLKNNIAEYVLYMWQVEDTIRACNFNIDTIETRIISQFTESEKVKEEIRNWYANLIILMVQEGVKSKGHLNQISDIVNKMNLLHLKLIQEIKDSRYLEQYYWAIPNIRDFEKRLDGETSNDIETCISGMYALLLLRLKKREISHETLEAMQTFGNLLSVLAEWYSKLENGDLIN